MVKFVVSEFVERRVNDRLGLVLFGSQAYLQAPLTFDRATVRTLLDEAVIGLAGKETAIGDAIGLAIRTLDDAGIDEGRRVLILLTDGANTAGAVEPLKAAEVAVQRGMVIYTVGVGADALTVRSMFGLRQINPSADLDEETLTAIADMTGGAYFRARDTEELAEIYALLDALADYLLELYWLRSAERMSNRIRENWNAIRVGHAIGASACFPPVFPPFLVYGLYDDLHVPRLGLTDGGVYDNMGVTALLDEDCTEIIASDSLTGIGPRTPKLLWLNSPSNPTGAGYRADDIRAIGMQKVAYTARNSTPLINPKAESDRARSRLSGSARIAGRNFVPMKSSVVANTLCVWSNTRTLSATMPSQSPISLTV